MNGIGNYVPWEEKVQVELQRDFVGRTSFEEPEASKLPKVTISKY